MRKRDAIRAGEVVRRSKEREAQSVLRRERRRQEIKVTARKQKTRVKIVVGAEALLWDQGAISISQFQRVLSDGRRKVEGIDQMLAQAGCAGSGKVDSLRPGSFPETATATIPEVQGTKAEKPVVAVKFLEKPSDEFRAKLPQVLGLKFDPSDYYWRGRSDPEKVKAMIRDHGQWELVRDIKITNDSS